jgi:TonB-dependent starch-binding outer membrane protein SusC
LGNQGINNFETIQTLISGGNSVFAGKISQGVVAARLPNPELRWETTSETNVGLDFAILSNKISGSIDYFYRSTADQLFIKPLPSVVGFTSVRTNFGSVLNKGVDIQLVSNNLSEGLKWKTTFNLSILKNEVTKLPDFTQQIIGGNIGTFISNYTIVTVGSPLQSFYGYKINGIFQTGEELKPIPKVTGYAAGMPKFVDQNGDGVIDELDRVILGDPFPDYTFGITNQFEYKGLSLNVLIAGVQGIQTLDANVTESLYPTNTVRNTISRYFTDRWTPENPSNVLPSGVNSSVYGGGRSINSLTVVDASFVRLKNVTLGYTLPLRNKKVIQSIKIYGAAENLLTLTGYEGFDPDASATGGGVSKVNYNSYPLAKTFRVGLDINF